MVIDYQNSNCFHRDLHPKNVLLDEEGHILLTYFGSWEETDHIPDEAAMNHFYCAPGNILVNLNTL